MRSGLLLRIRNLNVMSAKNSFNTLNILYLSFDKHVVAVTGLTGSDSEAPMNECIASLQGMDKEI